MSQVSTVIRAKNSDISTHDHYWVLLTVDITANNTR